MKLRTISHKFVDLMPTAMEDGVLYISIPYRTAIHKCACGCGETIVTPIRPPDWTLIWDGDTVTLYPSIGNWSLPCQSHYFIRKGKIVWARRWSTKRIREGRAKDGMKRDRYYSKLQVEKKPDNGSHVDGIQTTSK